jgi:hypothetical protein
MLISTPPLLGVLAICSTNLEGAVTSDDVILIDIGLICRNMDGKDVGMG